MKTWRDDAFCILIGSLFVVTSVVFAVIGYTSGVTDTQYEAIKADAGRWTCDPVTGVRTFKWGKE